MWSCSAAGAAAPRHVVVAHQDRGGCKLDPSVVAQIDGLCWVCLGIRVERDVCALSGGDSYCKFFGQVPVGRVQASWSTFVGLFHTSPTLLPLVVSTAAADHAVAVVVSPVWPGRSPLLPMGKKGKDGARRKIGWFDALMRRALLVVDLPRDAFVGGSGDMVSSSCGWVAVVADFGYIGKFKSKRRPEKRLAVGVLPRLRRSPAVGCLPTIPTRVSPLALGSMPSSVAPARWTGKSAVPGGASRWDPDVVSAWQDGYPCAATAGLAVAVSTTGVDPFVGDILRGDAPSSRLTPAESEQCRDKLVEEVRAGRSVGPFSAPPFDPCRLCSFFTVPKKKHDPGNTDVRFISNFSKGAEGSVNGECWSPNFLGFYPMASHIRDSVTLCGRCVRVWAAENPKCFRRNRVFERLLRLFVYKVTTVSEGDEFFVDLYNPFGWAPSEWGWQAMLAILKWEMWRREPLRDVIAYVDNSFVFVPANGDFGSTCSAADSFFVEAGIDLHDRFVGSKFDGLGWEWDLRSFEMVCPEDKHEVMSGYLSEWAESEALTLSQVRTAAGMFQWLSAGFCLGRADAAHIIHMRTKGEAIMKKKGLDPEMVMVKVSGAAAASFSFWKELFPGWNRRCPIMAGFGPMQSFHRFGRFDASTDWGCGGFVVLEGYVLAFSHEWSQSERDEAFVEERESTSFFELLAAKLWVESFIGYLGRSLVQLESDCSPAVLGLESGYSSSPRLMSSISFVRKSLAEVFSDLRIRHVRGRVYNLLADALSHGRFGDAACRAHVEFGLPLRLLQ